jgi:hypothetical protein
MGMTLLKKRANSADIPSGKASPPAITEQRHTAWTFGELPELLRKSARAARP